MQRGPSPYVGPLWEGWPSMRAASTARPRRELIAAGGLRSLIRSALRVPPAPRDHHAVRNYPAIAAHVLTHDVDIVELAFLNGQDRGVAGAARFEAAEFGPLQRHR